MYSTDKQRGKNQPWHIMYLCSPQLYGVDLTVAFLVEDSERFIQLFFSVTLALHLWQHGEELAELQSAAACKYAQRSTSYATAMRATRR